MLQTDKDELLIGLISDTHVPSRTPHIPEVIIEDFKDLTDRKTYKQIIENIHEALKEEFIELKDEADVLFSTADLKKTNNLLS